MLDSQTTKHQPAASPPSVPAAALRYFVFVFALSFLLGTIRLQMFVPAFGPTGGVIAELPLMLIASIIVSRQTLAIHAISSPTSALAMGLLALLMLMTSDAVLAWLIDGLHPNQWALNLVRTPGWIGLLGRIGFAFIPAIDTLLNRNFRRQDRRRDIRAPHLDPRRPGPPAPR